MKDYEKKYLIHLREHREGVMKAYNWFKTHELGWLLSNGADQYKISTHDRTKYGKEELEPYAYYNYVGNDRLDDYKAARVHHYQNNGHHWQHWIYISNEGEIEALRMPGEEIVAMVCDWWSFGWNLGAYREILTWYAENANKMILHPDTRKIVEDLLSIIDKNF